MPAKTGTPWDLTKEEMDAIQDRFGDLDERLVAFITEMLAYKKDVDRQLGEQWQGIDGVLAVNKTQGTDIGDLKQLSAGHTAAIGDLTPRLKTIETAVAGQNTAITGHTKSLSDLGKQLVDLKQGHDQQDAALKAITGHLTRLSDQDSALDRGIADVAAKLEADRKVLASLIDGVQTALFTTVKDLAKLITVVEDLAARVTKLEPPPPPADPPAEPKEARLRALEEIPKTPLSPVEEVAP